MNQQAFDFLALSRHTDPRTSHEAAASVKTNALESMVLQALAGQWDGGTSIEMAEAIGVAPWSVSPRMKPLLRKGLIRDSGLRRAGPSGRKSIVWMAT